MKFYKVNNEIVFSKNNMLDLEEINANVVDASHEKHVPVYSATGDKIKVVVGEIVHPMEEAHYIMWIMLEIDNDVLIHYLKPGELPQCEFPYVKGSKIYAYCNLHGLWKKEVI